MRKQRNSNREITIQEDMKIPGTNIILEAGDQIFIEVSPSDPLLARMKKSLEAVLRGAVRIKRSDDKSLGDMISEKFIAIGKVNFRELTFLKGMSDGIKKGM